MLRFLIRSEGRNSRPAAAADFASAAAFAAALSLIATMIPSAILLEAPTALEALSPLSQLSPPALSVTMITDRQLGTLDGHPELLEGRV